MWNKTDGSIAVITAVGTNSLTTTRLLGGLTNVWNNSDVWCIDPFVATLAVVSTSSYGVQTITQYEEVLVTGRSTDTLTVATGGRGYGGTTANTFSTNDSVYLFVTSPITERLKDIISVLGVQTDTNTTNTSTNTTNIGTLQDGTYHYVATTGSANAYVAATPALAAYAAGNLVVMKANFTNTGSATLNLNSLGAKTIKKNDGATNLAANDIISGQIVVLRYDGTNFQMLSPGGTPATTQYYNKVVYCSGTNSGTLTNPTSITAFDTHTASISANDLINGVGYEVEGTYTTTHGTATTDQIAIMLGSTSIVAPTIPSWGAGANTGYFKGFIAGTAAAGASVAVKGGLTAGIDSSGINSFLGSSANVATNGTLTLQIGYKFTTSNGGNNVVLNSAKFTKVSSSAFT